MDTTLALRRTLRIATSSIDQSTKGGKGLEASIYYYVDDEEDDDEYFRKSRLDN